MTIDPNLEYPLAVRPETPLWSENYAQLITDPDNHISVLFSSGTWCLDTSVWRENLAVTLPDGQVLVARNFGRRTAGATVSASLCEYEILEPEKRVRLGFSGPVFSQSFDHLMRHGLGGKTTQLEMNIEFEATAPMWDMHAGHEQDSTGLAGAMHIEQLGQCRGTLRSGGREFTIAGALSCRDHSRGPRSIAQYRNHCWINGQFPGGRTFQLYVFRMHHVEGIAMSLATVTEAGVHYPATVEQINFVEGVSDVGRRHTVVLDCALGAMEIEIDEVLSTIPVALTAPFNMVMGKLDEPHALVFDEAIRCEWNGQTGYGWCERGFSDRPI